MNLSSDLISQFVKVTNDSNKENNETTVYATVVYNGKPYVKLDGSDLLTPITTTADVKDGERVTVMIKNHTATVTGNISSPSARTDDVKEIGSKISEFEIVMAYKVTTEDLEAINATIENLRAKVASFTDIEAVTAEINKLQAKFASLEYVSATDMDALNAEIENLQASFATITDLTAEDLEVLNAEIANLKGYTADFTYVSADVLDAVKASIKELEVKKLSADEAELKYANIDFANIGEAAIKEFYAKSGVIQDVVISDGQVTGKLVGVTIIGDLIEGGTVKADKLVIQGEDGLYYKLNTNGETISAEQTEYNSLSGTIITAQSITAEKIAVDDLVAFDATIGGFNITSDAIYSGVKETADNTTRGIYLDNEGQLSVGDSTNFLRYYKDADGNYKLEISAQTIKISASDKTLEETISDVQANIDETRQEMTDQYTSVTAECETMISGALESYVLKDEYNSFKEETTTQLELNSEGLSLEIEERQSAVADVNANIETQFKQFYKHFRFTDNGLSILDSNGLELVLDSGIIKFMKNNVLFGWWDGNDFHTGNIKIDVTERAQFGNFAFVPRSDGSLSFLKVENRSGLYAILTGGVMSLYGAYPTLDGTTLVISDAAASLDGTTLIVGGE